MVCTLRMDRYLENGRMYVSEMIGREEGDQMRDLLR